MIEMVRLWENVSRPILIIIKSELSSKVTQSMKTLFCTETVWSIFCKHSWMVEFAFHYLTPRLMDHEKTILIKPEVNVMLIQF